MAQLKFDLKITKNEIKRMTAETDKAVKKAIRTIAQDLARTSSESAPHLTGDLEDSYAIEYSSGGSKHEATVEFAVFKGGFNYAIAMHEWTYSLGEGSIHKTGGTGMSGTSYEVGRKYLTRVLEGEADAYQEHIAEKIKETLR